ncbi:MAG: hypothetical protein RBT57_05120 [Paludibacter sp.]|nr:hypothetical protein [Paludibacter sp.]
MRIKFLSRPDSAKLEQLIEKYYEAFTSSEEEKELYRLLSHPAMKGKYEAERAMLSYFKDNQKVQFHLPVRQMLRQVAVVAVLVVAAFYITIAITPDAQASYAWINGKKVTNIHKVKSIAQASLNNLPSSSSIIDEQLKEVSTEKVIENQLAIFAENE